MRRDQVGANGMVLLVIMATMAACSSSSSTDVTDPVVGDEVAVRDDVFVPRDIVVSPGAEVAWTWEGDNPHDVTWDDGDLPSSATQVEGRHEVTMPTDRGEYGYHCTVHGAPGVGMFGTVTVQ